MLLLLLLFGGMMGVQGGPEAKAGYTLTVKSEVVVQEGLCILVPCEFSYPKEAWSDSDPVHGYWFRDGADTSKDHPVATNNPGRPPLNDTQGRFVLVGDPRMNNCSLDIRGTKKEDRGSYVFRLERGKAKWNYIWNKMNLRVSGQTWLAQKPPGKAKDGTGQPGIGLHPGRCWV
ncbi:sialic acid-binding Ig-like lectin 12 [Sigmodon hispidus]